MTARGFLIGDKVRLASGDERGIIESISELGFVKVKWEHGTSEHPITDLYLVRIEAKWLESTPPPDNIEVASYIPAHDEQLNKQRGETS